MADAVQIKLKLENAQLAKDLRKSERDFARLEAQAKKSAAGIDNAFMTLGRTAGALGAIATTGVAALTALGLAAIKTSKQFADLSDQAMSLDIDFTSFQSLEYAATQAGTSIEKVTSLISKAQIELGQALESGNKDNAFSAIGLDIQKLQSLDPEEFLEAVAIAINKIEDPSKRAAASMAIFGKGAREANQFLTQLADEGLEETRAKAERAGVVISELALKDMKKLDDATEALALQWRSLKADALAPVVDYLNGALSIALDTTYTKTERLGLLIANTVKDTRVNLSAFGLLGQGLEAVLGTVSSKSTSAAVKPLAKIDFSNFEPPKAEAFVPKDDELNAAGAKAGKSFGSGFADQAKRDAETYAKNFAEALSSSQFKTFEAGVDLASIGAENIDQIKLAVSLTKELADLQSGAFTKDHLANLEAEAIARYEINTAIIAGTEAIEKQQAAQEKSAKLLEALGTIAEAEAQRTQEMAEAISEPLIRAMDGVITGAISAQDAVKDLIRQLLIAVAQAALLAAFGQGSFGSNFSNIITGNRSATPQGGPTLRILNQSGGLVTTRRRSNGDTDLIIGQLAKAISTGGNQLDKAIRRTYGIGRQGV